mgnify:CR=1 FL=1
MSFLSRVRAPGRSVIASAIVAMLVLAASWAGLTYSTAQAAINENIKVSDLSLIPSNGNGVEDPTYNKTKVNDILKLKFTWDATTADPKSGQSFQIGLPRQFRNRENLTEPMTVTHNGADHTIGECVMDDQTITCTFNDTLDTLRGQGFNGLNGKGSALVVASEATEDSTATINAKGEKTAVPIPGGRITENQGLDYTPETLRKWAFDVTAASKQMDWEITLGPSQLKDALAAAGAPIALDGRTRSTITITGPFAADTNYIVYYASVPTSESGSVQPGLEYKNNVHLKGTDREASWSIYYTRSFTIDVELAPGFGGFSVAKLLTGSGAPRVPAGTTFDVAVDYTLPGGATVDTYQGWTAPGTVNDSRTGGRTVLKVAIGDTTAYPGTFPAGTVLTLSEDTSTASATPEGTAWGSPEFTVNNQVGSSLTIADQKSTAVTLKNASEETAPRTGQFSIAKTVTGDGDFTGSTFVFPYACDDGAAGVLRVPGDGTVVTSPELAQGTTCEISEDTSEAAQAGYSLSKRSVTIAAGEVIAVTATNTYSRETGTFSVVKHATDTEEPQPEPVSAAGGPAEAATDDQQNAGNAALADKEFTFTYTCDDANATKGTLKARGDGSSAPSNVQLPLGTSCTITEDVAGAQVPGYTLKAPEAQTVTISSKDQLVEAFFTNVYTPTEPEPTPTPSPTPSEAPSPEPSTTPSPEPSTTPSPTPSGTPEPSSSTTPEPSTTPNACVTPSSSTGPSGTPGESSSETPGPCAAPDEPGDSPSSPAPDGGDSLARTGASASIALLAATAIAGGAALLVERRRA